MVPISIWDLSPFLFIIAMEGLHVAVEDAIFA
ncbi:hypothetical protein Tco_0560431, partial [Tanacetum coccineum]